MSDSVPTGHNTPPLFAAGTPAFMLTPTGTSVRAISWQLNWNNESNGPSTSNAASDAGVRCSTDSRVSSRPGQQPQSLHFSRKPVLSRIPSCPAPVTRNRFTVALLYSKQGVLYVLNSLPNVAVLRDHPLSRVSQAKRTRRSGRSSRGKPGGPEDPGELRSTQEDLRDGRSARANFSQFPYG
jgi:hypothetical protein